MAPATTGVQGGAAEAMLEANRGPTPKIRNGNKGRSLETRRAEAAHPTRRGAFSANHLHHGPFPKRGGRQTTNPKAPGDDKGPPQADRDGTRAEMPAGSGLLRGRRRRGGRLSPESCSGEKSTIRMGRARGNAPSGPFRRRGLTPSRRLKCRQQRGKEEAI